MSNRPACRRTGAATDGAGELRHDAVLKIEHVRQQPVRFAVGQRLTGHGIHHACRDPEPFAGALKAADHGEVERGANVEVAYYDQQREQLDPDRSLFDTLGDGNDVVTVNGRFGIRVLEVVAADARLAGAGLERRR